MGTPAKTLISMLREREAVVRTHHEMRTGRDMPMPFTIEGMAADEIERLQKLIDGRDDFIVSCDLWEKFTATLK